MAAAFRYHGSKWRMYSAISQYMRKHTVYTEAFGGSAAIAPAKESEGDQ